MSCNRENVAWPAVDGTFNIGFWDYYGIGDRDDPEWDYEWDVEYVNDRFWWASTGHQTPDAALDHYCESNSNPGGSTYITTRDGHEDECARLDAILAEYNAKRRMS